MVRRGPLGEMELRLSAGRDELLVYGRKLGWAGLEERWQGVYAKKA